MGGAVEPQRPDPGGVVHDVLVLHLAQARHPGAVRGERHEEVRVVDAVQAVDVGACGQAGEAGVEVPAEPRAVPGVEIGVVGDAGDPGRGEVAGGREHEQVHRWRGRDLQRDGLVVGQAGPGAGHRDGEAPRERRRVGGQGQRRHPGPTGHAGRGEAGRDARRHAGRRQGHVAGEPVERGDLHGEDRRAAGLDRGRGWSDREGEVRGIGGWEGGVRRRAVQQAVAVGVVHAGVPEVHRGRHQQVVLLLGGETGAGAEEEREDAGGVGSRDRGAREVLVQPVAVGGEDVRPRGDDVGEGSRPATAGAGPAAAHRADQARAAECADRQRLRVVGRAHVAARSRPEVPRSEDRDDARRAQRLHVGLEGQVAAGTGADATRTRSPPGARRRCRGRRRGRAATGRPGGRR